MKDSIIIVSGGLDSITLLYDKAATIALAVSFDYGQNHASRELPFAALHCKRFRYTTHCYSVAVYAAIFQKFALGRSREYT